LQAKHNNYISKCISVHNNFQLSLDEISNLKHKCKEYEQYIASISRGSTGISGIVNTLCDVLKEASLIKLISLEESLHTDAKSKGTNVETCTAICDTSVDIYQFTRIPKMKKILKDTETQHIIMYTNETTQLSEMPNYIPRETTQSHALHESNANSYLYKNSIIREQDAPCMNKKESVNSSVEPQSSDQNSSFINNVDAKPTAVKDIYYNAPIAAIPKHISVEPVTKNAKELYSSKSKHKEDMPKEINYSNNEEYVCPPKLNASYTKIETAEAELNEPIAQKEVMITKHNAKNIKPIKFIKNVVHRNQSHSKLIKTLQEQKQESSKSYQNESSKPKSLDQNPKAECEGFQNLVVKIQHLRDVQNINEKAQYSKEGTSTEEIKEPAINNIQCQTDFVFNGLLYTHVPTMEKIRNYYESRSKLPLSKLKPVKKNRKVYSSFSGYLNASFA
jgi:hypothetical protein